MNKEVKNYIAIMFAVLFWALSFIWFKIANVEYRPITIVFLRVVISTALLTIYLLLTKGFQKVRKSDYKWFFLMAFLEPFIYFLGESYGLTYVSSTVASVLIATIPIFVAIGGWILYRERLSIINYSGILLSFSGVIIFIFTRDGRLTFEIRGLLLMFLAVLSAVGYSLVLKKLVENYSPVFIVNTQNLIGALLFLPLFLFTELKHYPGTDLTSKAFLAILQLSVFTSAGAFILFSYVVKNLGVTKANAFANAIPVLTALFAFLMLGELMTPQQYIGMVIVVAGLFLSQYSKKRFRSKP